jgi:hypothetical protein
MAGALLAKLDLGPVLDAVLRNGVAVVAEALAEPFRRLVAFFTVHGSAWLSVFRERAGEEIARFSIGPGSLALLRAPGLGGLRDGRPFHAIVPVGVEERVSIGLRMDTRR